MGTHSHTRTQVETDEGDGVSWKVEQREEWAQTHVRNSVLKLPGGNYAASKPQTLVPLLPVVFPSLSCRFLSFRFNPPNPFIKAALTFLFCLVFLSPHLCTLFQHAFTRICP